MPARDRTKWTHVEGDHSDDASYVRTSVSPLSTPTDEVRTNAEIEAFEAETEADEPEYDATDGAIEAARELGVDLATVTGSGVDGRIIKADVEAAAG